MSGMASIINGQKGGRPKLNIENSTIAPHSEVVILTTKQYNILLNKYGEALLKKALLIFDNWLITSPKAIKYRGRNNYAHFRADGWVINSAKQRI